jgi:predicted aspartyl protease
MADPAGLILLPVTIRGEEYLFMLDTGATYHVLDLSLRGLLGEPFREGEGITSGDTIPIQAFRSPELQLAGLPLNSDQPVTCMDLEILRSGTGHDIRGVLGIVLLKEHRVRLDWEQREVAILDPSAKPGHTWGDVVKIDLDPLQGPTVMAVVGGARDIAMLIDTGMDGTLTLEPSLFGFLVERGELRRTGTQLLGTAGGILERPTGRLNEFRLASRAHEDLIAGQGKANAIGLRCLRRHCVTFDLANQRLYLRPSAINGQRDRDDMSGLRLIRQVGQVVAYDVAANSPAHVAGICKGDVIVGVNGKDAARMSMSQIRQILRAEPGRQVSVELRTATGDRGRVKLTLEEEPWHGSVGLENPGR